MAKLYKLIGADGKEYLSDTPGTLGGNTSNKDDRIYGRLDCPSALRAIAKGGYVANRVFFANEADAIAAGFRPCHTCLPEKYKLWKESLPKIQAAAVDAYIAALPEEIRELLNRIRSAIRAVLPDVSEKISYGMPTFWNKRNLIHYAAQKNHLGIYPGAEAMEHFAPCLADYKTSKGAIQFPYTMFGEGELALIAEIAAWRGSGQTK